MRYRAVRILEEGWEVKEMTSTDWGEPDLAFRQMKKWRAESEADWDIIYTLSLRGICPEPWPLRLRFRHKRTPTTHLTIEVSREDTNFDCLLGA